jgi:hypothetical protein
VTDRIACWVEFTHLVEAGSEEEARQKYEAGESECNCTEVQESVDGIDNEIVEIISDDDLIQKIETAGSLGL